MRIAAGELRNLIDGVICGSDAVTRGKSHGEVLDPAFVRRDSEENKPRFGSVVWPSDKQNTAKEFGNAINEAAHTSELYA